jgi:hypothetical protein
VTLDKPDVVDAIGTEVEGGAIVLTIADSWDWTDERAHLLALQAKLNRYFDFIESGEIWDVYPQARGRQLVIDVVGRFPMPRVGVDLLRKASEAIADLDVKVRNRLYEATTN